MSKRPALTITSAVLKREKLEKRGAESGGGSAASASGSNKRNPFLTQPILKPVEAIRSFLVQSRTTARKYMQSKNLSLPLTQPIVEIEARLGTLKVDFGAHDMRVTSSGAKAIPIQGKDEVVHAFLCNHEANNPTDNGVGAIRCLFEGGISRSHFTKWTASGVSEASPISLAFGVKVGEAKQIVKELAEIELTETVYGGHAGPSRVCFPGVHPPTNTNHRSKGKLEVKSKLQTMDVALPSSLYDLRMTLSSEDAIDNDVSEPPPGWKTKRLKRRRTYTRRDKSFAWQLDVTEVSAGDEEHASGDTPVTFEIEAELTAVNTINLINAEDAQLRQLVNQLAQQLWWMIGHINPLSDVLDVGSYLRDHVEPDAVKLALAQCDSIKRYMDSGDWEPAIPSVGDSSSGSGNNRRRFIGCMPVNFSRHNIEDVQRCEKGYFLSEKTDGVRYLMIFTGSSVVLIDRSLKGVQPIPVGSDPNTDSMKDLLPLIQPGTVLDGEVVMHRELRRPIFIVFDVMVAGSQPLTKMNFERRLDCLRQAGFRTPSANKNFFADENVLDKTIALPLVRKNFVRRIELDKLLSNVNEERGHRIYKYGKTHCHLTDGIIFQPNRPYTLGTDTHLLKWKYLDTVTIDVEILPPKSGHQYRDEDENALRVGVMGEEGSTVDMTRYVRLPPSERLRLEADRAESGAKIAEVGFDPDTGEWYYLTMRPDKTTSNHISTVLGTLLELAESLGVNELRYRMSVPNGGRDTWRKDFRSMQAQLLQHQRVKNARDQNL